MIDEVRDPVGEHAGLPRPGPSDDQEGSRLVEHSVVLGGIQLRKDVGCAGGHDSLHSTDALVPPSLTVLPNIVVAVKHALSLPPFGHLADISALADLARSAEEAGWDGVFLWDHILRPVADPVEIADTWIALTAVAAATERVTIGPMVTPLTRRRPQKLAREVATLDRYSGGRLVLGLGLGVDSGGELSKFGETTDAVVRAERLDEGVELLCRFWSGEAVTHDGKHFFVNAVTMKPTPLQRPRVPLWFAARGAARRPVRRAARFDGLFPIEVDLDGLRSMVEVVVEQRGSLDNFDIAVHAAMIDDHRDPSQVESLRSAGVTWMIHGLGARTTVAEVEQLITTLT